ncbi:MAG: DedA family protein [Planctomycetes bacterium]|nr:DedA family protein [Planctomycetota bacterium]
MEQLVVTYGYWAIVLGTFLEGETILLVGGYAAHRGWLALPFVMLAAFAGSAAGDQLYFLLGRWRGARLLARHPDWVSRVERARQLLHTHRNAIVLGCRFLYGLRIVIPFAVGAAGIAPARFFALNLVGAAVWAAAFGYGGYCLGAALERVLGDIERYELDLLLAIAAVGIGFWLVRWFRRRRRAAR